jgi:glyceraldehyde 3-phosphate dehydrogenase
MQKLRVGINGFGRIGRAIFRHSYLKKYFEIVAINDINPDNHNLAYLLKYDTSYGQFTGRIADDENSMSVDGQRISLYHQPDISKVPWKKDQVDLVIESSGVKSNLDKINSLKKIVKNVVITYDPGTMDQTIVFGCNEETLDPKKNFLISSSICDSISLSPIISALQKTNPILHGFLVTVHPWLSYQNLLDGPSKSWSQPGDVYSHYALGRSAPMNMIPKSTSAITAAARVHPELSDKLMSFSYRIPTSIVSGAVLIAQLTDDTTPEEIEDMFTGLEKKQNFKVFKNSREPLTSLDYVGEEYSVIIDHRWTKVNGKRLLKLVYWYDNEWGYTSRVVDLVKEIDKSYA